MRIPHVSRSAVALVFLASLLQLTFADPGAAQISRSGGSFAIPGVSGGIRWPDVAYESVNNVYLAVTGPASIRGRFIRPDGTYATDAFQINSSSAYAQTPRVICSPSAGSCLVVWSDNRSGGSYPDLYGRIVTVAGGAPVFVSADFIISLPGAGSWWENGRPGMAYSTVSHQYLVTWRQLNDAEIHGRLVSDTGTLIGNDIRVTTDTWGEDQPAVAYNATTNRFLVGYQGWASNYNFGEARWVQAGVNPGIYGSPMRIWSGAVATTGIFGGDAEYNPVTGKTIYLFEVNPGRGDGSPFGIYGQRFNPDGSFDGLPFAVSTGYKAYDAMELAYNPISNTFALATHSYTIEDAVIELHHDGTPVDNGIIATGIGGGIGNYNPGIAASQTQAQWLLVTNNSFSSLWRQFLVTGTRDAGGAPPPQSAALGVDPQTINLSAAAAPNGSWVFAEGALGLAAGFSTYYVIANENTAATQVHAWIVREDTGAVTVSNFTVPPRTRQTLDLSSIVGGVAGSYSAVFQSATADQQIYVGRTVYWGGTSGVLTGAGHLKTGAFIPPGGSPSTNWYFAEGTRVTTPDGTPFQNYYMVFNPSQTAANVTVDFLSDDGSGLMTSVSQRVEKQSRWTLSTDGIAQLAQRNFSVRMTSSVGIVAERSMYWGANWSAGHTGFGASAASHNWYFAEGTAQTAFDTYFLLLNPTSSAISVNVTYCLSPQNGVPQTSVIKYYSVPANSRETVRLTGEVGVQLGVAAEFHATGPIVVERSMYWGTTWTEGSTVTGTTAPATEWHLPEGSTINGFETFLLLSNPNTADATVDVTTFSSDGLQETSTVTVAAKTRLTVHMDNSLWASIQGKAFSIRVRSTRPIVAEEAVYWDRLHGNGQYWRGGDATMGFPVIR